MRFFSRGKILLSGEYLVLFGAKALALPSKLGQSLEVTENDRPGLIRVNSAINDHPWFYCNYELPGFEVLQTSDERVSSFVRDLLMAADSLKPGHFTPDQGLDLSSTLQFDTRWGLGSSSSLISNLSYWLDIDPYELLWKITPGSGYDIACARASKPLIYQLVASSPVVELLDFSPGFKDQLYFVYLGSKQDSQVSVREFRESFKPDLSIVERISGLTGSLSAVVTLDEFEEVVNEHEAVMSNVLGVETIKQIRFPGFKGSLKSLGAWGGDFILATWRDEEEKLREYFNARGLQLIFRYEDLI
jgi:mevalonate kinase